jgi:hypothetical protein
MTSINGGNYRAGTLTARSQPCDMVCFVRDITLRGAGRHVHLLEPTQLYVLSGITLKGQFVIGDTVELFRERQKSVTA